ncbi:MAG: sugar phosphate isomerase/epimerase [Saprospiraceae bacterium]|jgi:sugar phosphate isomerase/epimerase
MESKWALLVAHKIYWQMPNLTSGNQNYRNEFLSDIKGSVEVAKRVNTKWMTVVPGHVDMSLDEGYQYANVIESLKQASALLEHHGVITVLEPVKKILNFDYPTASRWSIRQNFSNLKVGIRIFFVIRRFYAKTSFYDSDASIGEFKY